MLGSNSSVESHTYKHTRCYCYCYCYCLILFARLQVPQPRHYYQRLCLYASCLALPGRSPHLHQGRKSYISHDFKIQELLHENLCHMSLPGSWMRYPLTIHVDQQQRVLTGMLLNWQGVKSCFWLLDSSAWPKSTISRISITPKSTERHLPLWDQRQAVSFKLSFWCLNQCCL